MRRAPIGVIDVHEGLLYETARHAIRWLNSHGLMKAVYEFVRISDLAECRAIGVPAYAYCHA